MMKELMTLSFSLSREIMTSVRLVTGGIGSLVGLNLDDSEDCKVCVTESLLLLMRRGCERAKVCFFEDDCLQVVLTGEGKSDNKENSSEDEISLALLSALVERLSVEETEEGYGISFGFGA